MSKPGVRELLEHASELLSEGKLDRAKEKLARTKKLYPDDPQVTVFEAVLALAEQRAEDALRLLDGVLERDPVLRQALAMRGQVLMHLGRLEEAQALWQSLIHRAQEEAEPSREAWWRVQLARCLDRQGSTHRADREFHKAAGLAPDEFTVPPRLSAANFDAMVREAIALIPEKFRSYLRDVAFLVRDYPPRESAYILGTWSAGGSRDSAKAIRYHGGQILIYKRSHEVQASSVEDLREQVRKTIVHEIAHHFGIPHDRMGDYE